ncbi:Putative fluoride ion transporter CrcB [Methanimicrococcus hongohii]|uniref:Fluoride-specific ion channel FluC n=1 Tax=Methanimicrococcus hongohii TaxID=3028295 RepID=A0AA96V128_9EURY|nr:CrcB family protein [Methanimicrococcus sp. Hf6]WNY23848.1 Putative fluoride ion transporter CrcB [Methanimicrococcus sp. Hf6]
MMTLNLETVIFCFFAAGIGGAIGAFVRFFMTEAAKKYTSFPAGVLISNIVGTFLLALVSFYILKETMFSGEISEQLERAVFFFNTGILGSLTTFSAFSYDNLIYLEDKKYFKAAANIFSNILISAAAVFVAYGFIFNIL